MTRFLVSISIGPVQEFIAAARKTRDLWFGSEILSDVCKAAALEARNNGAELIFPAPASDDDLQPGSALSVANKLLFLAQTDNPGVLVEKLRTAVLSRLREQAEHARMVAVGNGHVVIQHAFDTQIDTFSEFYAAWLPYPLGVKYHDCRRQLETLLAARKGLRSFAQHAGSSAAKNTIDGVREEVIDPTNFRRYQGYQVKRNEHLDAIGLLKRFGRIGHPLSFDSTEDLAAIPYVRQLLRLRGQDESIRDALSEYVHLASTIAPAHDPFLDQLGNVLPGRLLMPDGDDKPASRESQESMERQKTIGKIDQLRSRLHSYVRARYKISPPAPYYAVFLADGDHMGKALDACNAKEAHTRLSQHLSRFAANVRQALETKRPERFSGLGAIVYAGGDDLLALLPLDTALEAAEAARNAFTAAMKPMYEELIRAGLNKLPTLSAALVIAHAQEDLTAVLAQARHSLEHFAKNPEKYGRDALAITLMRRSGPAFTTGGKWDACLPILRGLLNAYETQQVPFGLGYEWRVLAERCRRSKLADVLIPQWAGAVLQQKSALARNRLFDVVATTVTDTKSLDRLADQLVLAKALHDAGARAMSLPEEARS